MMTRRQSVNNTERIAACMPLMRMKSSGKARNNRAMRAIRDKRNNRAMRRIEALPKPPFPPPDPSITAVMTQVSATIMSTRIESKTNHPSRRLDLFFLNDLKRQYHSKAKNTQKKCSAIWKIGSAFMSTSALLRSVSTQIHKALKAIIDSVAFSKCGCRAMNCQMPVSTYRSRTSYGFSASAWAIILFFISSLVSFSAACILESCLEEVHPPSPPRSTSMP
mmetsp:Transcript_41392/g.119103  ORF Transcript_41392/g.119103 Transcript_41392/m.119103 type:complete len:221 (+) Transcript_41392:1445-2107(+)